MQKAIHPQITHLGIYVHDLERMKQFYTRVFGLFVTDTGTGHYYKNDLVFMSSSPKSHHQVVLSTGRPPEATFSTVMQMSFKVNSLDELREIHRRAIENQATDMRTLNHGNAWSAYFNDPEGSCIEVYLDSPFHVPQPHAIPLNLQDTDEEILAQTRENVLKDPGYMPMQDYIAQMEKVMG